MPQPTDLATFLDPARHHLFVSTSDKISSNLVIPANQLLYLKDTRQLFAGDGATIFSALTTIGGGGGGGGSQFTSVLGKSSGTVTGSDVLSDTTVAAAFNAFTPSILIPFEGVQAFILGHSYLVGTGASGSFGWAQRLAKRLALGTVTNVAVGGTQMVDAATNQTRNNVSAGLFPYRGIVFLESCVNDAADTSTRHQDGFTNSVRAICCLFRSDMPTLHSTVSTVAGWTYTGTWSTVTDTDAATIGGSVHQTATQGDIASVNVIGTELTLMLMGLDDTAYGTAGGIVSISCDGTVVNSSVNLSNRMVNTGARKRCYIPIRITGLNPGYHTITVTKTDATAGIVQILGIFPATTFKPLIYIQKDPAPVLAGISTYNTLIDGVVAEFDSKVYAQAAPSTWTTATNSQKTAVDMIHPNDPAHEEILQNVFTWAKTITYSTGLGTPSAADVTPAVVSSIADTFTRTSNANFMGATDTGSVPWRVETGGGRWGIIGNSAYSSISVTNSGATVESGKADCTVTVTVTTRNNGCGLRFRESSESNYILWYSDGTVYYSSTSNGSFTVIGVAATFASGDVLQVVLLGSSITCKKNGTTVATFTNSFNSTATRHGLHSNSEIISRYNAFSVV